MARILYLEDEEAVADMVMRWLRKANYDIVHPASQGEALYEEAVQLLSNKDMHYDFVLQDLQLKNNDPDSIHDRRIHDAVKEYKEQVNPRLCWIIESASTSEEMSNAIAGYPVDVCQDKKEITRAVLLELLENCSKEKWGN